MPKDDEDTVEVRCPECDAKVRMKREEAEKTFLARCPNGHEIPLVKAL
jgi:ssDNA-binding Zn-finger/Zn-ribbon topoisomerase 1